MRLARADGKWTLEGAQGEDAQGLRDRDPLGRSPRPEGRRHRSRAGERPGRLGPRHPDLRIALTDKEGQPIGTVLAAKHEGKAYVMRAGSETVFEARDYMYARLDKQPKDLVEEPGAAAEGGTATTTIEPPPPEPGEADEGDDADDGAD